MVRKDGTGDINAEAHLSLRAEIDESILVRERVHTPLYEMR